MNNINFPSVVILFFMFAMCISSCGNNGKGQCDQSNVGRSASISDDTDGDDEYPGMSRSSDTLTIGQYHQAVIDAIANGDKELFAELVCYPLCRTYPMADIEDKHQMISYFDTLFDEEFRKRVAELDSNSWDRMGWRGWMILSGEIWDTDPCLVVNYSSPAEQSQAEYLMRKDMSRLHPSLQGEWEPFDCYYLDGSEYPDFDYEYARVDVSVGSKPGSKPVYRVALFKNGASASDMPSVVLTGVRTIEGSMWIETFYFSSDEYYICIDPENMEDGKSYFIMTVSGQPKQEFIVPCKSQMQAF